MKSKSRKAVVVGAWVATGVLGAGALTGVAMAAGSSPGASTTGTSPALVKAGSTGTGAAGRAGRARALGRQVLHGEFTVATKNGTKVLDTEVGVITAVTPTTVAVRASDGYTQTWALGASTHVRSNRAKGTLADLKVGETVRLLGPASGGSATAALAQVRPTP